MRFFFTGRSTLCHLSQLKELQDPRSSWQELGLGKWHGSSSIEARLGWLPLWAAFTETLGKVSFGIIRIRRRDVDMFYFYFSVRHGRDGREPSVCTAYCGPCHYRTLDRVAQREGWPGVVSILVLPGREKGWCWGFVRWTRCRQVLLGICDNGVSHAAWCCSSRGLGLVGDKFGGVNGAVLFFG